MPARRAVAALAALGLLAGACGGSGTHRSTPPAAGGRPPAATTTTGPPTTAVQPFIADAAMSVGLPGDPTDWNPLAAGAAAEGGAALTAVRDAVLPSAFVVGPSFAPVRDTELLESATQTSSNPQTVTYRIDPRAIWSDGTPVTAEDFVYTWEAQSGQGRFHDTGGAAYRPASTAGYDQVRSVKAGPDGASEVVVTFSTPDPDWEALFSPLLPAHIATQIGFDEGFVDPVTALVSAGPYLVQSYQPGVDVDLVRNPRWWGPEADLTAITVDFVASASEAADGLLDDQLDAALLRFGSGQVTALRANRGLHVSVTDSPTYDDLVFDERAGPLAQAAVRRAFMLAVDRAALVHTASAAGDPVAAPVGNRAFLPGEAGYRDDSASAGAGGLARAEALLSAAGYTRSGPTLSHDGVPVQLTLAVDTGSPFAAIEAAAVEAAGTALGISVTTPAGGVPAAAAAVASGAFQLALVSQSVSPFPSQLDATYRGGAPGDISGYASTAMDALLSDADGLADGSARVGAVDRADALAWSDAVDLPLLFQPSVLAVESRYVGVAPNPGPEGPAYDIASWGIPEKT